MQNITVILFSISALAGQNSIARQYVYQVVSAAAPDTIQLYYKSVIKKAPAEPGLFKFSSSDERS